jgi:hypothetical protein
MTTWLYVAPRSPRSAWAGERGCASTPSATERTSDNERAARRARSSRVITSTERVLVASSASLRDVTRTVSREWAARS